MMRKPIVFVAVALTLALGASASFAQTAPTGPKVKPAGVAKHAGQPVPDDATTAASAGLGGTVINTANGDADKDSVWVAKFDLDGDGDVDETSFLWDDEDKVLFAWADDSFTCRNGATGQGALLIGVNAAGNARRRPTGSGFWIAQLDKSECNAAIGGLWGCKFDASGAATACGTATIDDAHDDIVVTVVK